MNKYKAPLVQAGDCSLYSVDMGTAPSHPWGQQ